MVTGFIHGGESQLAQGFAEKIREEVLAEYAGRLEKAGPVRRFFLERRIEREIRRRVARAMAHTHSPYNLYGAAGCPHAEQAGDAPAPSPPKSSPPESPPSPGAGPLPP